MADEQKRSYGLWFAVVFLLLLVVYPASTGPVYWLLVAGHLPESSLAAVEEFYVPVYWAVENVMGWYIVDVWGGLLMLDE